MNLNIKRAKRGLVEYLRYPLAQLVFWRDVFVATISVPFILVDAALMYMLNRKHLEQRALMGNPFRFVLVSSILPILFFVKDQTEVLTTPKKRIYKSQLRAYAYAWGGIHHAMVKDLS